MDFYIKNLAFIYRHDEKLYKELLRMVEPRPDVDWYSIDTMMRPLEWLFGLGPFSSSATIVQYGFGDGEHSLYVLDKLGNKGNLILVVPDVPEFLEMMHTADMEDLLGDARVHIVVCGINDDSILRYLASCLSPKTLGKARIISLPDYDEWYPEGKKFVEQALKVVKQWMKN